MHQMVQPFKVLITKSLSALRMELEPLLASRTIANLRCALVFGLAPRWRIVYDAPPIALP